MKSKKYQTKYILLISLLIYSLLLGACSTPNPANQTPPSGVPTTATIVVETQPSVTLVPTEIRLPVATPNTSPTATGSAIGMPNPASVYCEEQGGKVEIQTATDGSQTGVCVFQDGVTCDEWAFYRGECKPGPILVKPLTFVTPAPRLLPQPITLPYAVIARPNNGQNLVLFARDGSVLGDWVFDGLPPTRAILAGSAADLSSIPLIFLGAENNQPCIQMIQDGQTSRLVNLTFRTNVPELIGAPGQPFMAYSADQPDLENNMLTSQIYAGTYQDITQSKPVLSITNNESYVTVPVALRVENVQLVGIWFVQQMTGIGGDVFMNSRGGLYYLDLASGVSYELLPLENKFSSLSISQTLVAWYKPGTQPAVQVTNLQSGKTTEFPLLADSERGAVRAFISPSNSYVVWMEGKGIEWDNNLRTTLRIGTTDGTIIAQFADAAFSEISGLGSDVRSVPLGWLDEQTVLVQAYIPSKDGPGVILRLDVLTGEMAVYAEGLFVNFAYP